MSPFGLLGTLEASPSDADSRVRHLITCVGLQNCEPLWLQSKEGARFPMSNLEDVARGSIAAESALEPPDAVSGMA